MAFVLDASVVMNWAFPDEADEAASMALRMLRNEVALVPAIWWFEVRNVLLINERRQRISEADTRAFLGSLSEMNIEIDRSPDDLGIATLCRRHRLSVYDTSYLELAARENIALATLDKKLGAAAKSEGVALIG
jgi:predicted nucleic acid-binding protein